MTEQNTREQNYMGVLQKLKMNSISYTKVISGIFGIENPTPCPCRMQTRPDSAHASYTAHQRQWNQDKA